MLRNQKLTYLICCLAAIFLIGCGSLQEKNAGFSQKPQLDNAETANSKIIKDKLYTQFNKWQGVRYRYGGSSKHGIDCSGFVQVTFRSKLGVHLPRTTSLQAKLGREVKKSELKAGDLVFFRTGITSKHVGIYLEENKFLHASEKRGVTISKLDNVYWKANYWKAVRM